MLPAINTHLVRFLSPNTETGIANPPAALGAVIKVEMGFQIGFVKGGAVFLCPQELSGFLIVNVGKAALGKRKPLADPFPSAAVAEKTERKTFLVRMVFSTLGQGYTHKNRMGYGKRPAYLYFCLG